MESRCSTKLIRLTAFRWSMEMTSRHLQYGFSFHSITYNTTQHSRIHSYACVYVYLHSMSEKSIPIQLRNSWKLRRTQFNRFFIHSIRVSLFISSYSQRFRFDDAFPAEIVHETLKSKAMKTTQCRVQGLS